MPAPSRQSTPITLRDNVPLYKELFSRTDDYLDSMRQQWPDAAQLYEGRRLAERQMTRDVITLDRCRAHTIASIIDVFADGSVSTTAQLSIGSKSEAQTAVDLQRFIDDLRSYDERVHSRMLTFADRDRINWYSDKLLRHTIKAIREHLMLDVLDMTPSEILRVHGLVQTGSDESKFFRPRLQTCKRIVTFTALIGEDDIGSVCGTAATCCYLGIQKNIRGGPSLGQYHT